MSTALYGSGKQPPAPLASAISKASSAYGVPADLLAGIWRVESGGNYPNAYVNPSGYGGLFGTRDWNAPVQTQANLAASILAQGLRSSGGDIAGALSYYNSGKLQGGYTSVPGETTFGNVNVPGAANPGLVGGAQSVPVSFTSGLADVGGAITGAIKEAAIRLGLVLVGFFLLWLGIRQFGAAVMPKAIGLAR